MSTETSGPVLIDLEAEAAEPSPADAPPISEEPGTASGRAMQSIAVLAGREPSLLVKWFWRLLGAILVFALSLWAWDFVTGLVERSWVLGALALVLVGLFAIVALGIAFRELAALGRLKRLDEIHTAAEAARTANDLEAARKVADRVVALYRGRDELTWAKERFAERQKDVFDPDAMFSLVENTLLEPLDAAAQREVEAAARQVATVTALVPIALADVIAALAANLRMIRRIAEVYGGRGGTLGAWRLTRAVFTHLIATGAVAVGDDLLGSLGGGHLLAKISRRFGEGLVNGALTARVGIAAIEVCRPLPFQSATRPSVSSTVARALTGLFAAGSSAQPSNNSDSAPK